ncbi:MAG: glycosyltransferase [Bacteroidales bacterium]|nr:glycosyltransferase [Bacteroidales bacterium]
MANFIEQTIKSVIGQEYPNLEYIIIDGKSTDNTLSIINKYKDKINTIISEPDNGQYDAIQKGMNMATGEVLAWLNADDVYFPWTLKRVAKIFSSYPEIKWISGIAAFLDEEGDLTNIYNTVNARPSNLISKGFFRHGIYGYLQQESMFWRRELWESTGGLNLSYKLAGDFELWTRFARISEHVTIGLPLSGFRMRAESRSKIQENKYFTEVMQVYRKLSRKQQLIHKVASTNQIMNKLIRLFVWKKALVYYFSISKQKWILEKRRRPVSSVSFSQLLLEK